MDSEGPEHNTKMSFKRQMTVTNYKSAISTKSQAVTNYGEDLAITKTSQTKRNIKTLSIITQKQLVDLSIQ